jgi:four helix bundle protein
MRDFRKIKAWQRAHALAIAMYKLTRGYRRAGFAGLRSQLTAAAASISTNIVEGCGAPSNKEFARYLAMSIDSANETEYHLLTSRDLSLIEPNDWQKYTAETIEVRKMIYTYRMKVLSDDAKPASAHRGATLPEDANSAPDEGRLKAEPKADS